MEANASYRLAVLKQTISFPRSIKVRLWPTEDDSIIEAMCALDIGDVVEVKGRQGPGAQSTALCFVEHLAHSIVAEPAQSTWDLVLSFSSADRWFEAWGTIDDYIILDSGDEWDSGKKWAP